MKLFEGQDAPQGKLQVNKQYAEKFRKKKERELLDKAEREQIKPELSDSSIEDEDGQLVNEKITDKFIETLAKIRFKHPDIYQRKDSIFSEQDFEDPLPQKKVKKLTYKDQLIDEEQEYQPKNGITPLEEQQQLKNAFKKAAEQSQKLSEKELLKIKRKNLKEIEDENKEFDKFLKHHKPQEQDLLQRFWGNEEELDEKDKFLRKYILTKGWIDKEDMDDFQDSDEDEDKMDQFEEKYNFRYEEPGGAQIITYERDQPDTLRIQEEKARKRQRLAKQQRREEQKKQLEQELKQLKIAKKNEIIDKLQKIQEIGGLKDTKLLLDEIQKEEFDPSTFDKQMNQVFDKKYFQEEDSVSEMQIEQVDDQDDKHQDINNVIQIKPNIPLISRKNLNEDDIKVLQDEEVNIWWFCDYCKNGIDPGAYRWDCQICDDYTLCENCQSFHQQHKLKKSLVPKSCKPPEQEDLEKLISIFRYCRTCSIKMTDENEYYKWKKQTLCTDCWEKDVNQDKFSFVPAKIVDVDDLLENNPNQLKDQLPTDVKQLVDEYYNLDFEDVIAGGLKTKFQYVDVDKNGFGLTNDDLLYADDKLLNKYISIKKLAPYRSDVVDVNRKKHANLLAAIRASAKRNKKDILKNKPIVQKQEKQQQVQLEVEDAVENNTLNIKSSRLKSYGV